MNVSTLRYRDSTERVLIQFVTLLFQMNFKNPKAILDIYYKKRKTKFFTGSSLLSLREDVDTNVLHKNFVIGKETKIKIMLIKKRIVSILSSHITSTL